jgi:hypothetical protein
MFRDIASDFDRLSSASWVITAYLLGLISAQPLVWPLERVMLLTIMLTKGGATYSTGSSATSTAGSRCFWRHTLVIASVACLREWGLEMDTPCLFTDCRDQGLRVLLLGYLVGERHMRDRECRHYRAYFDADRW